MPLKHEKTTLKSCSYSAHTLFLQNCQLAQIQPKYQCLFHKNLPPRDFSIMALDRNGKKCRKVKNDKTYLYYNQNISVSKMGDLHILHMTYNWNIWQNHFLFYKREMSTNLSFIRCSEAAVNKKCVNVGLFTSNKDNLFSILTGMSIAGRQSGQLPTCVLAE